MRITTFAATILFFWVVLSYAPVPTQAEPSCGGIFLNDLLDPFSTCAERDTFSMFFNTTLPSDVTVSWDGEVVTHGAAFEVSPNTALPLVLNWDTLPQPPSGCGPYGDLCLEGLAVELFYRDGEQFIPVWYGPFYESGLWVPSLPGGLGGMYQTSSVPEVLFQNEGEYFLFVHRPENIQVSMHTPRKRTVLAKRSLVGVRYAHAYDEVAYGNTVVGGLQITVVHEREYAGVLSLPSEDGYDGVRGVVSSGPYPTKGLPYDDVFTFKVVYSDTVEQLPDSVELMVGTTSYPMHVDDTASDAARFDGDATNGEQYQATTTLPLGGYTYGFVARNGTDVAVFSDDEQSNLFLVTVGYSSPAFFPGFQASRLFADGLLFEDQLWEPTVDGDARALALSAEGVSLNADIYTKYGPKGVVDEGLGFTENVYKSFLQDLRDWKEVDRSISDFAVLAYDWRLAYEDILGGGVLTDGKLYYDRSYATSTPYIFERLETLAASSDSGRVVLVGHSMGGLLMKKMLFDLEDDVEHPYRDLLGKIDTVVLVASPQLGTPKAAASLLHGYGQELDIPVIGIPNFATDETLRALARNMPSAYTLLPSTEYFNQVHDIDEHGTALPETTLIDGHVVNVTTYDELRYFFDTVLGPISDDLVTPLRPRTSFLDDAQELHDRIDEWYPPDIDNDGAPDFTVVQIAGWGVPDTLKGIEYVDAQRRVDCEPPLTGTCYENYRDPRPVTTYDGDGTVVLPSAVAMGEASDAVRGVETWYVDMYGYNEDHAPDRAHSSVTEIDSIRSVINLLIQKNDVTAQYVAARSDLFIAPDAYLHIGMHSPVDVSLTDHSGRHVGVSTDSTDDMVRIDEEVPNSYYYTFAEGTYLGVPLDGEAVTLRLEGMDEGTFTLELREERKGIVHATRTFSDVPVSSILQGHIVLRTLDDVSALTLDTDGDGSDDVSVYPDEVAMPVTFDTVRVALAALDTKAKRSLLRTTRVAEYFATHKRPRLAQLTLRLLERRVRFLTRNRLPTRIRIDATSADKIVDYIRALQTQV